MGCLHGEIVSSVSHSPRRGRPGESNPSLKIDSQLGRSSVIILSKSVSMIDLSTDPDV